MSKALRSFAPTKMVDRPGDIEEPDPKRVRFNGSSPDGSVADDGVAYDEVASSVKLRARDVVELRFVCSVDDIGSTGAADEHDEAATFSPTFLHQIFPKEEIVGYSSATLAVYVDPLTLATWLDESAKPLAGVPETMRTPLKATLAPFVKAGLCSTRAEFESALRSRNEHTIPATNRVREYRARGERFGVFKEKLERGEELADFHKRICFFMFVHVDGASFIDDSDPRWELFLVHRLDKHGAPREFVGYATIYPFAAMRGKNTLGTGFAERLRISQVLVMPGQQGRGHGARLLEAVCEDAEERGAMEVTVEDPSEGFRLLRDLTDLRRAYKKEILQYKAMLEYERVDEVIEALHSKLQIAPKQARRCLEVHQLIHVDKEDEEAYKKYRLWVKRRLYNDYLEVLDFHEEEKGKEGRKAKLTEIYSDVEKEYMNVVDRLAKRGASPGSS